jgi:hypothetical protein
MARKARERQSRSQQSELGAAKNNQEGSVLEFVREEMRAQSKKMNEALKLSEEANRLLKAKIYEEYRVRLIELMNKKGDENTVGKVEAVLERFVDGLANMSHNQAVLAKEVKLKQEARREASLLKSKLATLSKAQDQGERRAQSKSVSKAGKETAWLDCLKAEARMLTLEAENSKLLQEAALQVGQARQVEEQLRLTQMDLEAKQEHIDRLKKEVVSVNRESQIIMARQEEEFTVLRKQLAGMQGAEKQASEAARDK